MQPVPKPFLKRADYRDNEHRCQQKQAAKNKGSYTAHAYFHVFINVSFLKIFHKISIPPLTAAQIAIDEFCQRAKFARETVKLPTSGK